MKRFNRMGHLPGRMSGMSGMATVDVANTANAVNMATIATGSVASVASVVVAARGGVASARRPGRNPVAPKAPNRMAHPGRAGLAPVVLVDQKVPMARRLARRGCVAVVAGGVAPSARTVVPGGVARAGHAALGVATKALAAAVAVGAGGHAVPGGPAAHGTKRVPGVTAVSGQVAHPGRKAAGGVAHAGADLAHSSGRSSGRSSGHPGRAARGGDGLVRRPGRAETMMRNHLVRLVYLACLVRGARLGRPGREVAAGAGFPVGHRVGPSGAARKDGVLVWDDALVLAAQGRACLSAAA